MKHQYETLNSLEQGETIPLEQPATPDTLANENHNENQGPAQPTRKLTSAFISHMNRSTGNILIPDKLYSVSMVRKYVFDILHLQYDVPRQEAETVAARWRGALGSRFCQMTLEEFESVFGEQYAYMIKDYRDTAHDHNTALERKKHRWGLVGAGTILVPVAIMFLMAIINRT